MMRAAWPVLKHRKVQTGLRTCAIGFLLLIFVPGYRSDLGIRRILIFTKTNGFHHHSIEAGIRGITRAAQKRGWQVRSTRDAAVFNERDLKNFKTVLFLSTTGTILNAQQKKAFEAYIENGGGYAGIHSASDTEPDWIWYNRLIGTHFKSHTLFPRHVVEAEISTETNNHPACRHLPKKWKKEDEWYNFDHNVRGEGKIQILLTINEASYPAIFPERMGKDHPISWTNQVGKGRMFYTGIGHTSETFTDSDALQHILGGIEWAGRL